ncbi:iron chelate uptake ABC transporter family permease subunit, partial [Anaerosporobacter sp.]|uniref:iron chelate uptake ABC transporter family permease subunit n=1 Tax=Anaerosporobacter sp. TaxID=1872529 RepID=UPI00286EC6C3
MKKRVYISSIIVTILFVVTFLLAIAWGSYSISFGDVIKTLFGQGTLLQTTTIWDIRLPRICVAIVVGVCLSTAGCVLQSVTRNELTESGMIGINAGAAVAVVLLISYGSTSYYDAIGDVALYVMPFVAIVGALLSGFLIY